jgi:FAD-dependent oxidoreductase domain-containing protein 1
VLLCINSQYELINIKLNMDDVVIIGGGIIGTATAYFLSKEGRKVKVIERDPTYKTASFPLSLGGFRRQFFQKENILLGKFAREFIFKIPEVLKTEKNPNPTASMVTNGYLLMFGPEHAEEQYRALENHKECDAGTKNIKGSDLSNVFPTLIMMELRQPLTQTIKVKVGLIHYVSWSVKK